LWLSLMAVSLDVWRVLISMRPPNMYAQLAQGIESHRVLSDIPYVAAHGKQPEMLDPSVNHYLELAKHWSPEPVLNELRNQEFDYVIVGLDGGRVRQWRGLTLFSHSILREIEADYRLSCTSDRVAVYIPKMQPVFDSTSDTSFRKAGCAPISPV